MSTTSLTPQASECFDTVIGIGEQFIAVISQENELLRARQYTKIGVLQKEKARLGFAYENQMKFLTANPSLAQTLSPAYKLQLKKLAEKMDQTATENVHLLSSARTVNIRVMEAIRDAAMEQVNSNRGYAAIAKTGSTPARGRENALSVSVDKHF